MKLTTHLSTPWGWKAELILLADLNGYPSAAGPVQTSESSPVRDQRSTTEPPNQLRVILQKDKPTNQQTNRREHITQLAEQKQW